METVTLTLVIMVMVVVAAGITVAMLFPPPSLPTLPYLFLLVVEGALMLVWVVTYCGVFAVFFFSQDIFSPFFFLCVCVIRKICNSMSKRSDLHDRRFVASIVSVVLVF